ncbi:MAG: CHAD domain-containing protein [Elainellaceae cyanobacterium]
MPQAIKRIAHEQIESSIDILSEETPERRDEVVHQARKHFKKLRALVRLIRGEIGNKTYRRENGCFQDASHQLETLRDSQVRLETLDALLSHYSDSIGAEADGFAFEGVRDVLLDDYTSVHHQSSSDITVKVLPALKKANRRVNDWQIDDSWNALGNGLYSIYARGRRALEAVAENPSPKNLHDWRKRVKDLWYHLRLLAPLWPDLFRAWRSEANGLAELLGDDHDLVMLRDYLMEDPTRFEDEEDQLGVLLSLIRRRQLELQTEAISLGQRLYAESPKAFAKRVKRYWIAWRAEHEQAAAAEPPVPELPVTPGRDAST